MTKIGWWFAPPNGRLAHNDGRIPRKGVTHEVDISERPIRLCDHGLHASEQLLDAVKRAQSWVVYRVKLSGEIVEDLDEMCAQRRTYLTDGIDISSELLKAARMYALDVIDLWDAPEVVRQWLETGDDQYREAAESAASASSWSPSESAWLAVSWSAWSASAAEEAAAASAAKAVWSAASSSSWSASAVWSAAASAVKASAAKVVWSAASSSWSADNKPFTMAMNRYNDTLTQLVLDAHPELAGGNND